MFARKCLASFCWPQEVLFHNFFCWCDSGKQRMPLFFRCTAFCRMYWAAACSSRNQFETISTRCGNSYEPLAKTCRSTPSKQQQSGRGTGCCAFWRVDLNCLSFSSNMLLAWFFWGSLPGTSIVCSGKPWASQWQKWMYQPTATVAAPPHVCKIELPVSQLCCMGSMYPSLTRWLRSVKVALHKFLLSCGSANNLHLHPGYWQGILFWKFIPLYSPIFLHCIWW